MKCEHVQPRNEDQWLWMWDHLRRVFPGSDYIDSHAGETWEYMGTWFSSHATHDNRGVPIRSRERGPCWNHQFRHRAYPGTGRLYVNVVADFHTVPHAVEAAEAGVEI